MASLLSRREELRALRLARSQPESAGEFQELIEEIIERTVRPKTHQYRMGSTFNELARGRDHVPDRRERPADELLELGVVRFDQRSSRADRRTQGLAARIHGDPSLL